jgi:PD-(D/E)XK nuclease superfamily
LSSPGCGIFSKPKSPPGLSVIGSAGKSITGHIDFVQVRNGSVHILDYKPDARTNKPVAQLTIYALALSRLTGIKLFDIKCAWFNENEYCEFFPANYSLASRVPKTAATCLYLYSALAGIVSDLDARVQGVTMAFVQNIEHPMCERLQNTLAHSLTLESTPKETSGLSTARQFLPGPIAL